MLSAAVTFALISGSAYRLTRLITLDTIADKPRAWWWRHYDAMTHPLGQLVLCAWCVSFWTAGLVVLIVALVWSLPLPLLWWAAASTVCGFLGQLDGHG